MKFAKMLLAAVAFFAAAGYPAFASSQQYDQQGTSKHQPSSSLISPSIRSLAERTMIKHLRPQGPRESLTTIRKIEWSRGRRFPKARVCSSDWKIRLNTKHDKAGRQFIATTLEPVTTAEGEVIPQGVHIRGHIDKVHAAGDTGRARMWLTFDDIQTRHGWRPFVAQLIDAPGVHSIHVLYDREGEIQAASVNRDEAMKAAMVGALAGAAATGMSSGKEKETAMAAATAAAQAFMVAYGLGQEFTLEKGTKLELVLERPLRAGRT